MLAAQPTAPHTCRKNNTTTAQPCPNNAWTCPVRPNPPRLINDQREKKMVGGRKCGRKKKQIRQLIISFLQHAWHKSCNGLVSVVWLVKKKPASPVQSSPAQPGPVPRQAGIGCLVPLLPIARSVLRICCAVGRGTGRGPGPGPSKLGAVLAGAKEAGGRGLHRGADSPKRGDRWGFEDDRRRQIASPVSEGVGEACVVAISAWSPTHSGGHHATN